MLACDRQALRRAGFPIHEPVWCGWFVRKIETPNGIERKKVPDWPWKGWRKLDEVEGPNVGINVRDPRTGVAFIDLDRKDKGFRPLIEACGYVEKSPSERGVHLAFAGHHHQGSEWWHHPTLGKIEVYGLDGKARFVAMTGAAIFQRLTLPDVLDDSDPLALLRRIGFAPTKENVSRETFTVSATLPEPPTIDPELVEWAALIDAAEKGDGGHDFGRFGRFPDRSGARYAWLRKAAWSCQGPDHLAALLASRFAVWLGTRSSPDSTIEGEIANVWADHVADMPPTSDGVSRETLAEFGIDPPSDAERRQQPVDNPVDNSEHNSPNNVQEGTDGEQEENDFGGGGPLQGGARGQLSIPDLDLAEGLKAQLETGGGDVMHAPGTGKGYFLDARSGLWLPDEDGRLEREIYHHNRETAALWLEANPDVSRINMQRTRAEFGGTGRMSRVRTALQAIAGVDYHLLDQDPLLVGMVDGVYDVEKGRMRPGKASERVTISTAVAPDSTMDTPVFRKFLERIFRHEPELIGFMQRWCGYCLTGLTTEQLIVFAYGRGSNGKTTFFERMKEVFGRYGQKISAGMLMERKQEQHATEIAQLMGKRFVLATEVPQTAAWNEARLKELSGGDTLNANLMRQDKIEFRMEGKLTIVGNHKPKMDGNDYALTRRLGLVPFTQMIAGDEIDPNIKEKLAVENRGILWWAIQGLRDWRRDGLQIPQCVKSESTKYFRQEDMVQEWVDLRCMPTPGQKILIRDAVKSINEFLLSVGRKNFYGSQQLREELQTKGLTVKAVHAGMYALHGYDLIKEELKEQAPAASMPPPEPRY